MSPPTGVHVKTLHRIDPTVPWLIKKKIKSMCVQCQKIKCDECLEIIYHVFPKIECRIEQFNSSFYDMNLKKNNSSWKKRSSKNIFKQKEYNVIKIKRTSKIKFTVYCLSFLQVIHTISATDKDDFANGPRFNFFLDEHLPVNPNFTLKDNEGEHIYTYLFIYVVSALTLYVIGFILIYSQTSCKSAFKVSLMLLCYDL